MHTILRLVKDDGGFAFEDLVRDLHAGEAEFLVDLAADGRAEIVSGGTDNHLMLLDLRDTELTGKELEARLDEVHITANKNTVPGEPRSPFVTSGVRIGTPAVTTRGFGPDEMVKIASFIERVAFGTEADRATVTDEVLELCAKFPLYQ